ncbi:hypothetical protein V2J09_010510 [Rumex salicifolius]
MALNALKGEMSLYIRRESSKLWKRFCAEISTEIQLLGEKWKYLLAGIIFQYMHGLAARGVHYLHRPGPILQDSGFFLLPELGAENAYISEAVFDFIFLSFFLWTFHPFILKSKKIYTVLIWCRVLAFLVACQLLRIITFYSTQLPGPNYHCREGSKLATLPRPESLFEFVLIKREFSDSFITIFIQVFPLLNWSFMYAARGILFGCGDLIFSSHMIFSLVFVRTYHKYGTKRWIKQLAWLVAIVQSLLIIASRKHYTVDIIVAWYELHQWLKLSKSSNPTDFICCFNTEMPDRSSGVASLILPLSNREKDGKAREDTHKLLNGNSVESVDWRQRTQMNGKSMENGHAVHPDSAMNGVLSSFSTQHGTRKKRDCHVKRKAPIKVQFEMELIFGMLGNFGWLVVVGSKEIHRAFVS